ncbi:hypothetical protein GGX14DRAFT_404057 [Mycena pura]|uniref:Uncharacterized protein n=1 Tax=Mycena pura TaxID=153505 RepID=A0AAD6Y3X7_9AGAR|nr:hypothetical protein GGX14DRAFT_404057 [Mycena pura]
MTQRSVTESHRVAFVVFVLSQNMLSSFSSGLPREIPRPLILRLESIIGANTQQEMDDWHNFCAAQEHPDIKLIVVKTGMFTSNRTRGFFPPKFLSNITDENWVIPPNHSNIIETARNAETSIRVAIGLLTAILQFVVFTIKSSSAQQRQGRAELLKIERDGVMRHRWNGV